MRPTLRQLEYIVTVHRLGRFGLAADVLNVSQPSLSAQIAAVEHDLNIRLFERDRGGVQTTSKGLEFIERAQSILRDVIDLRHAMTETHPFSGTIRLGVLPSIGPYLLPQAVKTIHAQHPNLRISVREENTLDLEKGLKSGRFDVILSTPEDHPNTQQFFLFNEKLFAATATDDLTATSTDVISLPHLRGRRLLTLDTSHRLSRIVYAIASKSGGIVSDDYEGTTLDSLVLMAATGAGIAVLPEVFATRQGIYREEVVIKPLALTDANRDIALISPAQATSDELLRLLCATLQEVAQNYGLKTTDTTI